jgi:hypothetical protein
MFCTRQFDTNIGASLKDRVDPVTAAILCLQGFLEETVRVVLQL